MYEDGMTTDIKKDGNCTLSVPCSQVQLARVGVRVIVLVDVICVMLVVLITHVVFQEMYSFTRNVLSHRHKTRLRTCNDDAEKK